MRDKPKPNHNVLAYFLSIEDWLVAYCDDLCDWRCAWDTSLVRDAPTAWQELPEAPDAPR
jgi:hypothetical protein